MASPAPSSPRAAGGHCLRRCRHILQPGPGRGAGSHAQLCGDGAFLPHNLLRQGEKKKRRQPSSELGSAAHETSGRQPARPCVPALFQSLAALFPGKNRSPGDVVVLDNELSAVPVAGRGASSAAPPPPRKYSQPRNTRNTPGSSVFSAGSACCCSLLGHTAHEPVKSLPGLCSMPNRIRQHKRKWPQVAPGEV